MEVMSQSEFCEGINQVVEDGTDKTLTSSEMHQCRAVLGAAQWRCYQTAPQHAARLSHLQSILPKGDRTTLKDINKFVREIYGLKQLGLVVYDLKAESDEDLTLVGWSDWKLTFNSVSIAYSRGRRRVLMVLISVYFDVIVAVFFQSCQAHQIEGFLGCLLAKAPQTPQHPCKPRLFGDERVKPCWVPLLGRITHSDLS